MTKNRFRRGAVLVTLAMAAASLPAAAVAAPSASGCANRNLNNKIDKFLDCVNGDDVFTHLQVLQDISDANGGTRASGTPGYDASADYVAGQLEGAGYEVTRQEFSFFSFEEISVSMVADGAPVETQTTSFSESGEVTGTIIPVDLDLGLGNASSSACEAADFAGLDFSGDADIALVQRGACSFAQKAVNAEAAGAEAVIIFNQGNAPGRFDIIGSTLGGPAVAIPVLDVSYDDAVNVLLGAQSVTVSAVTVIEETVTENIIADLDGVNTDNVVMAGAHLDSVQEGPGIQDNGTGSATILATALAIGNNKKYTPQNSLRFAWWGAEESGLIGSTEYIFNPEFGISDEDYAALALYLNFDMVGSPNFIYGVYDADQSTFTDGSAPIPAGSAELEDLFEAYYTINDIPYEDTEFSGRSDYQAFINVGIPSSGLFTGAEQLKTEEQQAIWGGVAGEAYDQCYHQECDTIDNVNAEAIEVNVDAIAYSIFVMAGSTEPVNGVEGVDVRGTTPADVEFDGPQGTFLNGGGGLAHDHDHGPGITS